METKKRIKAGNEAKEAAKLKKEFESRINQAILSAEVGIQERVEEAVRRIDARIEKIRSLS